MRISTRTSAHFSFHRESNKNTRRQPVETRTRLMVPLVGVVSRLVFSLFVLFCFEFDPGSLPPPSLSRVTVDVMVVGGVERKWGVRRKPGQPFGAAGLFLISPLAREVCRDSVRAYLCACVLAEQQSLHTKQGGRLG